MTHETTHQLGAIDVYGVWNKECLASSLSIMSCSGSDNTNTYQLDPWHKLVLGWTEPQIGTLAAPGSANLAAADSGNTSAPLILYDPTHGLSEFFILEFRSNAYPGKSLYDANIPGVGIAIWHLKVDATYLPVHVPALGVNDPTGCQSDTELAVFVDGQPVLVRAQSSGELWTVGQQTPALRWLDGTAANFAIKFDGISSDGKTASIQWLRSVGAGLPSCQFSTSCQGYYGQPPTFAMMCSTPVDFYQWAGTPINATTPPCGPPLAVKTTTGTGATSDHAGFIAACNPGTSNECRSESTYVSVANWCHPRKPPSPPPTCQQCGSSQKCCPAPNGGPGHVCVGLTQPCPVLN
jgi:hypothetical protein